MNGIKNKAHGLVTTGKLKEAKEFYKENDITTYEELSVKGYDWNAMHYTTHFDKPHVLKWLILHTFH